MERRRWLRLISAGGTLPLAATGLVVATAGSASALPSACQQAGTTVTCTYTATGAQQTFSVPAGVSTVDVTAEGAPGASAEPWFNSGPGGRGAVVAGSLTVSGISTLYVEVGGAPTNTSSCFMTIACVGGFNGGGSTSDGGGGGGASDVRTVSRAAAGTLASRVLVAGGGGGSGGGGSCTTSAGGAGGDAASDGMDGVSCGDGPVGGGGKAGGTTAGGTGGTPAGHDGTAGTGGDAGDGTQGFSGGGGGGGGLYGGGGGGDNVTSSTDGSIATAAGGGGGSNLVPTGGPTPTLSSDSTGSVVISYAVPPATQPMITGTPPAGGVGEPYSFTFTTSGTPTPTVSRTAGSLPPGLQLSPQGRLFGTPTRAGSFRFTATATNSAGHDSEQVTVAIRALPALRIGDVSQIEGNSGTKPLAFPVTLSRASSLPVTVQWTTANGSATAPSDYVAAAGTLTIPAGARSGHITVQVRGDRVREPSEVFYVLLHNAAHAHIADPNASGGIVNND